MRSQLQTDEVLAATAQAYPCLYDKSDPGYKDELVINYGRKTHEMQLEMRLVMTEVRLITCSAFVFL